MCENTFAVMERIRKSGINEAFVPTKPVSTNFFCGRTKELANIMSNIINPGAHVLLYGDRGVGKTSLATHACEQLRSHSYIESFIPIRCNRGDTFDGIMRQLFHTLGYTLVTKVSSTSSFEGGVAVAKGAHTKSTEEEIIQDYSSPRWVAEHISHNNMVVIVDEFDTIEASVEKEKFSQLIKILSDSGASTSLLIVGIAMSASDLLEGHLSVSRSLTEVKLDRMSSEELMDIIKKGEERTGLKFDEVVKQRIVESSFGFPYFTHLLSLKAAIEAVQIDATVVTEEMLKTGLMKALDDGLQIFKEQYNDEIGVNNNKKKIIYCCAQLGDKVFSMDEIKRKYFDIYDEKIESITVSNALHDALSETPDTILRRRKQGSYYFNDPRMPVYVILRQEYKI